MSHPVERKRDDVEHLLRNAELRNALEPFFDESITQLSASDIPTPLENEYLASMLAWERAPALPIAEWFSPPLLLDPVESLSDAQIHDRLWLTIGRLYSKRIVLDFTAHLSDRQLYQLIQRQILPQVEKKVDDGSNYLHWGCIDSGEQHDLWLRFYASPEEREGWAEMHPGEELPAIELPPYPRDLPRDPL